MSDPNGNQNLEMLMSLDKPGTGRESVGEGGRTMQIVVDEHGCKCFMQGMVTSESVYEEILRDVQARCREQQADIQRLREEAQKTNSWRFLTLVLFLTVVGLACLDTWQWGQINNQPLQHRHQATK